MKRDHSTASCISSTLAAAVMIAFTPFPAQPDYNAGYGLTRRHTDVTGDDLDDFEPGGSKLTFPGEALTSSQAYMRYGIQIGETDPSNVMSKQRSWDLRR